MGMNSCIYIEHGTATVMTHYDGQGRIVRYEITQIDDAPGATIICSPDVIKQQIDLLNDALAAATRLYDIAQELLDELAETIDGEWGCCDFATDMRAGRMERDGSFDPIDPDFCEGVKVIAKWQPKINAARDGDGA